MILVSKHLLPKRITGLAFWPIIVLREHTQVTNTVLVNHEKIHLRQQAELLVLPFYLWYFAEWLLRIVQYKNFNKAYRNISFEREAYARENEMCYLKKRSFWAFLAYIRSYGS